MKKLLILPALAVALLAFTGFNWPSASLDAPLSEQEEIIATVVMEASNDWDEIVAIVNVIYNRAERGDITPLQVVRGKVYGPFYGHGRIHLAKTKAFIKRWPDAEKAVKLAERGVLPDISGDAMFFDPKFWWGKKIGKQYFAKTIKPF